MQCSGIQERVYHTCRGVFRTQARGGALFATCATVDEDLSVLICSKNNQLYSYDCIV